MNKKIIASVLAVAFTFSMVVGSAGAVTIEELQAQITALLAQITTLQTQIAGQTTTAVCFNTDLQKGMTSNDVMNLQIKLGVTPTSGYFGSITFAAVKTFQTAHGIINTGYVGPLTRAALNTLYCTPVVPTTTTTVPTTTTITLTGGAGSVQEYNLLSAQNDEEVGEGADDIKVLGATIEADDGSDLKLTALRLTFDRDGDEAVDPTDDLEDYAKDVSVWFGSTEVARVDADAFNDDNDFSKTLTIKDGAIIEAGEKGTIYVAISGLDNVDSDNEGEEWNVDIPSVRLVDAQGATFTDDPADVGDALTRNFAFETFAAAEDLELKLAVASDNPEVQVVEVDDSDSTDGVTLLKGTLKAIDDDIEVKEVPFILISASAQADIDTIATDVTLKIDGDEVQSLDVGADCDVDETDITGANDANTIGCIFDDVDVTINSGDIVAFEILVDLNGTDDMADGEGSTLSATVDADNIDAEDSTGEGLDVGDLTGSIIGEDQALFSVGINVTLTSAVESKTAGQAPDTGDIGTYTIKFKVTAFGTDAYVDNDCSEDDDQGDNGEGTSFILNDGDGVDAGATVSCTMSSTGDTVNANFEVLDGTSETVTLTVAVDETAGAAEFVKAGLEAINWGVDDGANSADQYYIFNLDDFETNDLYLSNQGS